MDFIYWWFDQHYIVSTLLTPTMTFAWSFYQESLLRGIISGILTLGKAFALLLAVFSSHEH